MGGCAQIICKYYAILHKGLENLQIFVSEGVLEPIPLRIPKDHYKAVSFAPFKSVLISLYILSLLSQSSESLTFTTIDHWLQILLLLYHWSQTYITLKPRSPWNWITLCLFFPVKQVEAAEKLFALTGWFANSQGRVPSVIFLTLALGTAF